MDEGTIISADTRRKDRVPPGQHLTERWPVLHYGEVPDISPDNWALRIFGLVENEKTLGYAAFKALPRVKVFADIHCVTTWSRLNNLWEGVSTGELKKIISISPAAKYAIIHAAGSFTTNLPVEEFFGTDVLFATRHNEEDINADHGGPVRLVVPRLYFWKSAKWVSGIEFAEQDRPGFWETAGYHNHGDPWLEERYRSR